MNIMMHSENGLEYCKDKLVKIFPELKIEKGDSKLGMDEFAIVEIENVKTINDILSINGYAYMWQTIGQDQINFYIDISEII